MKIDRTACTVGSNEGGYEESYLLELNFAQPCENQLMFRRNISQACFVLVSSSLYSSTLNMEVIFSSEMPVDSQLTTCVLP
jgi:hypothetical protein